jgi:hypothetical protein
MSIVVLAQKTRASYQTMSTNKPQFSIVGTTRNQGYVGQENRSRWLSFTSMRGTVARGWGGDYNPNPNITSTIFTPETSDVVKKSVSNSFSVMKKATQYSRPQTTKILMPPKKQRKNPVVDALYKTGYDYLNAVLPCSCNKPYPSFNYNYKSVYAVTKDLARAKLRSRTQQEYIDQLHNFCQSKNTICTPLTLGKPLGVPLPGT